MTRRIWQLNSKRFRSFITRPFCTKNKPDKPSTDNGTDVSREFDGDEASSIISRQEAYKKLQNLDFMTATKILFTTPPKRKKFGIDFHLVQLFFACLPSFAVYLVAQYARSEMRRMEAELEVKKKAEEEAKAKAEEEAKAKEMELKADEEQRETSDPQLLEVKERLDKLEEAIKDIVVTTKKSKDSRQNSQADNGEKREATRPGNGGSDIRHSTTQDSRGKEV